MNNKVFSLKNNLIIIILTLLVSFTSFLAFNFIVQIVIDDYNRTFLLLGIALIYLLPIIYLSFYIKEKYFSSLSKIGFIILTTITDLILIGGIILISLNFDYFLSQVNTGFLNSTFPIDLLIIMVITIILNIFSYLHIFNKLDLHKYLTPTNFIKSNIFFILFQCIYLFFVLIFAGDALTYLIAIRNITINPFGYLFLFFYCLTPLILSILYVVFKATNKKLPLIISIILPLVMALLFILNEVLVPNFVVDVGKPLFLIDFALSEPLMMVLLGGLNLIPLVYSIVFLIIHKKAK